MKEHRYYTELANLSCDGNLSEDERAELREHIRECDACRRRAESAKAISDAFETEHAPDMLSPGVIYKLGLPPEKTGLRRFLPRAATLTAAAAAIVILVLTQNTNLIPKNDNEALVPQHFSGTAITQDPEDSAETDGLDNKSSEGRDDSEPAEEAPAIESYMEDGQMTKRFEAFTIKSRYEKAYPGELLDELVFSSGSGTACLERGDGFSELMITLTDGAEISKRFEGDDYPSMSAGDIDGDGYDELALFLEINGSDYGGGNPVVLREENGTLVELASPLSSTYSDSGFVLSELTLCDGAFIIDKGKLRVTEYIKDGLKRYYDMYPDGGGWYISGTGYTNDGYDEYIVE